ncbi:unnamed protein product [Sphagnum balticum]
MEISPKDKIWQFILDYSVEHGKGPTLQKIADHMGWKHRQQVSRYMRILKDEGRLTTEERMAGSIEITTKGLDTPDISYEEFQKEQERLYRESQAYKPNETTQGL